MRWGGESTVLAQGASSRVSLHARSLGLSQTTS